MTIRNKTIAAFACISALGLQMSAQGSYRGVKVPETKGESIALAGAPVKLLPGKMQDGSARSGYMRLGEQNPLVPPFCETFDNFREGMEHSDFDRYFQTIDANDDGRSWGLYNYAKAEPYGRCAYLLYPVDVREADDWLIPRAVKLEAGKYYCVSLDAALYSDGEPHKFEVKYGLFNDPDGLDTMVIPATEVSTKKFTHVEGWICPEFDTKYYIGIHAISTTQYGYLFVDNITVNAPKDGKVPAGATDVTMTNSPDGVAEVTITFTAPSQALDGTDLASLSQIKVMRGDVVVKTLTDVAPGSEYTVTDRVPSDGEYVYTITASNETGEGVAVRRERYVGMVAPVAPEIVEFKDNGDGRMRLEWSAPATDLNGTAINPDIISYNVYDVTDDAPILQLENIKDLSAYIDIPDATQQSLVMKLVTATVNGRESEYAPTDMLVVGEPYKLPFKCSFTNEDYYKYVFEVSGDEGVTWRMLDDYSEPKAQDGDNGYICMIGSMPEQESELTTGILDFVNVTDPAVSFYTYVYSNDENEITISVTDMATGEKTEVETIRLADITRVGWNRLSCTLGDFTGKKVRISIKGRIETHGYMPFDNLVVDGLNDYDVAVDGVRYPQYADAGEEFEIFATVVNSGIKNIESCSVSLERNGEVVATRTVENLNREERREISFTDMFTATSPMVSEYVVRADLAADGNRDDNVSEKFTISFIAPIHPAPVSLAATESDANIVLTWTAPDMSKVAPEATFDDFESYAAFSNTPGDWTMIDADKGYVGGFQGFTMPGIDGTQQAWWVMSSEDPFTFISPRSGSQCMAQMYAINAHGDNTVPSDDWLVSPALYGGPQSIRFHVCSLSTEYGYDTFEVYYSESGNTIECFKQLLPSTEASDMWKEYVVSLPDGARYFAVRCTSNNIYMLMLDDCTYIPEGTPRTIELKGYNVYCNGEMLNTAPITETTFTTALHDKKDEYFVTALYDVGESVASNVVSLEAGAVMGISTDDAPAEYFDMRGLRVDSANLQPGIYVCRQGRKVSKVVIR